jgi:iron complex outermembrane receptor protein
MYAGSKHLLLYSLLLVSNVVSSEEITEITLDSIDVKSTPLKSSGPNLTKPNSTASRLGITAFETPASVETLDAETVRSRGDIRVRDAVSRTTGITDISTPGNGVAFSARGFTGNNVISQAEDGFRLIEGAGTLTYPSDTWGYERFEILRGPSSVLFGNGGTGATINAIRKQPKAEYTAEALAGYGTRGEYRLGVGGSGAIGEVGAFRIDASTFGGNGYIDRGDFDSKKIMSNALFNISDNLRINFILDHSEENPTANFGSPLVNGNLSRSFRKANYNVDNNKMEFIDTRFRTKLEWDINPDVAFKNEAFWFKADREWRNAEGFQFNPATGLVRRSTFLNITHDMEQYGNRMELSANNHLFGLENKTVVGWEIFRIKFFHQSNAGNTAFDFVPANNFNPGSFLSTTQLLPNYDTETDQKAFFLENNLKLNDKLSFLVGLRQENIDVFRKDLRGLANVNQDYSPFTWRLGTVFNLTPTTALYGQLSEGSDPVTSLISLNLANQNFTLTTSKQQEVGIKHILPNGKGELTLAAYHIERDDIITRDPLNQAISIQGGKQSSKGVEVSASLYPTPEWRVDLNAALLSAQFDELIEAGGISRAGNVPQNVPEKTANAWVYYQLKDFDIGLGARYVGMRYANNANNIEVDGYTVYDASAAWYADERLTLRANLRNITDKFYATSAYGNTQFIVGQPRQLELTAEVKF